jgi:hypothetical protein
MAIGQDMSNVWHNHPYLILGLGGVVVLYFLWPSSSAAPAASTGTGMSDYQAQLAAEAGLSQSQLATQASVAMNNSDNQAAIQAGLNQALGVSNVAIAEANAAAQVSNNQTAQTIATSQADLSITQTQAASSDFQSLVSAVNQFGSTTAEVQTNPIDSFFTSVESSKLPGMQGLATLFAGSQSGVASFWANMPGILTQLEGGGTQSQDSQGSSAATWGQGWFSGGNSAGAATSSNSTSTPTPVFQPNLYASLISQLITAHSQFVPEPGTTLPTITLPIITAPQMNLLPLH